MRSDRQTPHLTIVVPCYNEQQVLPETVRQLTALLTALIDEKRVAAESDICFVDDGSVDATWALLCKAQYEHAHVGALKLSRNQGHQNALMAGLMNARGAVIISLDADLQDDLAAIGRMLDQYVAGAEIVYGVRNLRVTDTASKRITARLYYRLLQWMNVEIVFDHADYRLMSRVVIEALRNYGESNLFLRALIPQLGFQSAIVTYDRLERFAGVSKYPLVKMLALAMDGITSFSNRPLRFISFLGAITSFGAILMSLWGSVRAHFH